MKKTRKAVAMLAAAYFISSAGAALPAAAESFASVEGLTVNYMTEPLGVGVEGLRFGWKMASRTVGARQEAYEINVTKDGASVWSSGKVESGLSVGIPYEGPALESASRYGWTVTVWDESGDTATSDEAGFETALADDADWESAQFIRMPNSPAAPIFRAEKAFNGEVISARLYITALGVYSAQINGKEVYKTENGKKVYHHMNPGYGNADRSIGYETYDVTEQLKGQSAAVVTVTAGTGWNNGSAEGVLGALSGSPAVKAMLVINTDQGVVKLKTNTAEWKGTLNGPITANGVYLGEDYDAGKLLELGDYQSVGYNADGWTGGAEISETPYIIRTDIENPRPARYMRLSVSEIGPAISEDRENRLQIMELEAMNASGINCALGAAVAASENFEAGPQWLLSNINDGSYGPSVPNGYTTRDFTNRGGALSYIPAVPVTVDFAFENAEEIKTVNIVCRTEKASVSGELCPNYPKTFEIQISDDGRLWETVAARKAGDVWNSVLFPHELEAVEYAGEIRPSGGMSGRIVDEFSQNPLSAVIYTGTKAQSDYLGGEIDVEAEYSGAEMFDDGITLKDGQTMVVNMGQNLTAIPEIKFSAARGVRLYMKFAEMLNDGSPVGNGATQASGPKGSIYTKSLRNARSEVHYAFAGTGEEVYRPTTSFFGYQYVELRALGGDVKITGLRSLALSSVSRQTGFIETNNADVNRLFKNALFGQLSNFFTIPTDCPQRDERLAWTGDIQAFARTGMYNFDSAAFLDGYQDMLSENTLKDGFPSAVLSLSGYFRHWATGWSDAAIVNPYSYYVQTGDRAFLEKNWPAMNAYMDYLRSHERGADQAPAADKWAYGDWLAFQGSGYRIISDCYYGYVTSLMAEMARVLGDVEKEAEYREKFERQKQTFLETYVTYTNSEGVTRLPAPTFDNPALSARFEPESARYLRITAYETGPGTSDDGEHRLQIMELEVSGDDGENYALNKTAESDNDFNNYGWTLPNLTDGNLGTGYSSNINPSSEISSSPISVTVDLGMERIVSRADIYCRVYEHSMKEGVCPNHPRRFTVELSADKTDWHTVGEYSATAGEAHSLTVHSSLDGYDGLFMANAGKAGVIEDNSQTSLLWMLKLGWYSSDEMRDEAIAMLAENIKNENPDKDSVRSGYAKNTLAVGFMGSNIITPTLSDAGRPDISYDLLLSSEMPSWLFEVRAGATTVWERWNSYDAENGFGDAEMNSYNHFAYGSVAEWMYRYMAGITSDDGFKKIILQPTTDTGAQYNDEERIRSVSGRYDSYYGTVISEWKADESGDLTGYHAVVPANTTAELYLPVPPESLRGFKEIAGVSYVGMTNHNGQLRAKLLLESGSFDFAVTDGLLTVSLAEGFETPESPITLETGGEEIRALFRPELLKDYIAGDSYMGAIAVYNGDMLEKALTAASAKGFFTASVPLAAADGRTVKAMLWTKDKIFPETEAVALTLPPAAAE